MASSDQQSSSEVQYIFKDGYFDLSGWERSMFRIITTVVIWWLYIGASVLILLLGGRWIYLGIYMLMFAIFVTIRIKQSDWKVSYLVSKLSKFSQINLALILPPKSKDLLIKVKDFAREKKIDFIPALVYFLIGADSIRDSFLRLDFSPDEIENMRKKILEISVDKKIYQDKKTLDEEFKIFVFNITFSAFKAAQQLKKESLDEETLALAALSQSNSFVTWFNDYYHLNWGDLLTAFSLTVLSRQKNLNLISGLPELSQPAFRPKKIKVNKSLTSRPTPLLDDYGIDWTDRASRWQVGVMIGHEKEYQTLIDILNSGQTKNILLVGPAGSGKETIVSYLAHNIIKGEVPKSLQDGRVISLSIASLFSGTDKPEAVFNLLLRISEELLRNSDIVLFLPEFHVFKQLRQAEKSLEAFEVFKPVFSSNMNVIIGSVTPEDYHKYLEGDSFVQSNFSIITVEPVSQQEAIEILAFKSLAWERKIGIKISYKAIKRAVVLASSFFANICLPTSAENLLTEALEGAKRGKKKILLEQDIVNLVSVKTNIPLEITDKAEKEKLLNLDELIHQSVIDQEEAVDIVASALRQYRAGLANTDKPIGVFLFVGPTGVGKTELAKTLAKIYFGSEKLMIRFDMATYQDKRSVSYFVGDPTGETAGVLTESVKSRPHSLILLDEFEKAHPDILNLFLSIFDEGRINDNQGQLIDFTNTIIIATSNALSEYISEELQKGTPYKVLTEDFKNKLTTVFKPELLNRFDEIIIFKPLTLQHLEAITKLKLKEIQDNLLSRKHLEVSFAEEVVKKLTELGYDPVFGARPLNSVIRHYINEPLAVAILSDEISEGQKSKIKFELIDNRIQLTIC